MTCDLELPGDLLQTTGPQPLMTGKNGETQEELGPFEGQARRGLLDSIERPAEGA